jgi:hypothetical protein
MRFVRLKPLPLVILALALAVGGFLRFRHLDALEMSADEGFSWQAAAAPTLGELIQIQLKLNSGKGPLHDLALHYWIGTFGDSVVAMRSLSALIGTLTILLAFMAMRELLRVDSTSALSDDERNLIATLTALMLAVNLMLVQYSREARMYPILLAAVLAQLACFGRFMGTGGWGAWVGMVVLTPFAVLAHFMAGLVFAVEALWLAVVGARNRWNFSAPQTRRVVALAAALALGMLMLLPFAHTLIQATVFDAHHGGFTWIAAPKASAAVTFFATGVGLTAILPIALLALWGTIWGWQRAKGAIIFMLLWMWMPALMLMVLSYTFMPALVYRYLITSIVPFLALAAMGIAAIPRASLRVALLAIVVGLSLWDSEVSLRKIKDAQYREAARVAEANLVNGSSILVVPDWAEYAVRYYLRGSPAEATVNNKSADPPTTVILFLRQVSHTTLDSFKREYPITLASLRRIVVLSSVTTSPSPGELPARGQQD